MIYVGSDHVGFDLKTEICNFLNFNKYKFKDLGCFDKNKTDYPKIAQILTKKIKLKIDNGILICGTGVGMSIVANRHPNIRAVVCSETYSATMAKKHNDSNVLCLGARVIGSENAFLIIHEWLNSSFEGGRHLKRIKMFNSSKI